MNATDARVASTDPSDISSSTGSVISINNSNSCCLFVPLEGSYQITTSSSPWYAKLLVACFISLIVVGGTGNLLVLTLAFFRRSNKQAVVQLLMACLAVCDVMMLLSVFWVIPTLFDQGWTLGDLMCKLETSFGSMAGDFSINTVAIIGVDRFLGLSRPECSYFTLRSIVLLLLFVWIAVIAIDLPFFFYTELIIYYVPLPTGQITTLSLCNKLVNMNENIKGIYQLADRLILFFLPLGITWFSYGGIFWKMTRAKRQVATGDQKKLSKSQQAVNNRVGRLCTIVASTVTFCWTPTQLYTVLYYFNLFTLDTTGAYFAMLLLLLPVINSGVNPLIYGLMWKPYRQAIRQILGDEKHVAVADYQRSNHSISC